MDNDSSAEQQDVEQTAAAAAAQPTPPRPPLSPEQARALAVTATEIFAERCPRELCAVMGLVSHTHRKAMESAKRTLNRVKIVDVVASVELLDEAICVAPSIGLDVRKEGLRVCEAAVLAGNTDVLVRAVELGIPIDVTRCWVLAVEHGCVPAMSWLRAHDNTATRGEACPGECEIKDASPCELAARSGQLEALQWLRSPEREGGPCPWSWKVTTTAAQNGQLEMLKWCRIEAKPPCEWNVWACNSAAKDNHLDVLKWALTEAVPPAPVDISRCWYIAIEKGNIEIMAWLLEHDRQGCIAKQVGEDAVGAYGHEGGPCAVAAEHGQLEALQWLRAPERDRGPCPCGWHVCHEAAKNGDLSMLKWARTVSDPPLPWNEMTCTAAVQDGNLDLLKWLRNEANPRCPWDESVATEMAHYDRIDILKWARTEADPPVPWDEMLTMCATHCGNLDLLPVQYLRTRCRGRVVARVAMDSHCRSVLCVFHVTGSGPALLTRRARGMVVCAQRRLWSAGSISCNGLAPWTRRPLGAQMSASSRPSMVTGTCSNSCVSKPIPHARGVRKWKRKPVRTCPILRGAARTTSKHAAINYYNY